MGYANKIVNSALELQPGYVEHTNKRFNLKELNGEQFPLPPFTGIITMEKLNKWVR